MHLISCVRVCFFSCATFSVCSSAGRQWGAAITGLPSSSDPLLGPVPRDHRAPAVHGGALGAWTGSLPDALGRRPGNPPQRRPSARIFRWQLNVSRFPGSVTIFQGSTLYPPICSENTVQANMFMMLQKRRRTWYTHYFVLCLQLLTNIRFMPYQIRSQVQFKWPKLKNDI